MLRLILFLPLAAVLKQSLGLEYVGIVSDVPERLKNEIVEKHNAIRRGVMPTARNMLKMEWSEEVSKNAKIWARKCRTNISPEAERKVRGIDCGQNLRQANYISSWSDAIELWYSPTKNFQYGLGAIDKKKDIYSYTQLIWYNSYLVGCALAFCPHKTFQYLYVCNYCHAGNIIDQTPTPYKDGPSCGDCPSNCDDKLCTNPCTYVDKEDICKELVGLFTCKNKAIQKKCEASCKCKTEII